MGQALWQADGSGTFVAEHRGFRLLVTPIQNLARYQVMRLEQDGSGAAQLLTSGHSSNVRLAMAEAERVADLLGTVAEASQEFVR